MDSSFRFRVRLSFDMYRCSFFECKMKSAYLCVKEREDNFPVVDGLSTGHLGSKFKFAPTALPVWRPVLQFGDSVELNVLLRFASCWQTVHHREIRLSFFGTKVPKKVPEKVLTLFYMKNKKQQQLELLKTATNFATSSTKFETKFGSCFRTIL